MRATLRAAAVAASLTTLAAPLVAAAPAAADPSPIHLDSTWGTGGVVRLPRGLNSFASGTTTLSGGTTDGEGGAVLVLWGEPAALIHIDDAGTIDAGYGGDGTADLPAVIPNTLDHSADGGTLVTGSSFQDDAGRRHGMAVRVDGSGQRVSGFGDNGVVAFLDPASTTSVIGGIGPDGTTVLAGARWGDGGPSGSVLARYLPDGALDTSFGTKSKLTLDQIGGGDEVGALAVDAAGRTYVLMRKAAATKVLRILPSGALDTAWGTAGSTTIPVDTGDGFRYFATLALSPGGALLVKVRDPEVQHLFRLLPSGLRDLHYGTGGDVAISGNVADGVAVLDSGAIAVRRATADTGEVLLFDAAGRSAGTASETSDLDSPRGFPGVAPMIWSDGATIGDGSIWKTGGDTGTSSLRRYLVDLPDPRPGITSVTPGRTAAKVSWTAPEDTGDGPVLRYVVTAESNGSVVSTWVVGGDVLETTVTGITNGVPVRVSVLPITLHGPGQPSTDVSVTASASAPLPGTASAAREVHVTRAGTGAAVATWAPPTDDGGSPIVAYVAATVDTATNQVVSWVPVPANARSASITGLQSGHSYATVVAPFTPMGFGALASAAVPTGPSTTPVAADVPWVVATPTAGGVAVGWGPLAEHGLPTTDVVVLLTQGAVPYAAVVVPTDRDSVVVPSNRTGELGVYVVARSGTTYGAMHGPTAVHVPTLGGNLPTTG